ncbi:pyruvate dehydrogenase E1 component alpha subunit [Actinopolyspora mzabensis]|uniref:Pyruvate dehydrogenase E1 component subunit alpha n=1 Tax=Actinopolyspora mzabensis TaxID=995066 RepID=A0A1G8Z5A2_ACTMZ|nr:pyruvate dehydrogenase (acetyl-transferring) E1 component subunit alpha [Actinopolyspora mzabensis]SDK09420.1 pyruvate dehydrogenase E1 component alpha subunit [Actinopolyspora mzabensis]
MAETATRSKSATSGSKGRRSGTRSGGNRVQQRQENTALASESPEALRDYFRQMSLVRRFEERAAQGYTQAKIGGYCHLNLGEEATVVGLMSALRRSDYLFTNYREHGYALAKGIEPGKVMAELYGRTTGTSKGLGGSMHMFDTEVGLLGGYGIVGGQIPLATGAALAIDYRGGDEVVLCQMGDGTTNIGAFHESMNIAALWNLPVVFVVVNNYLGMGTTVDMSSAESELYKRAVAYRMHGERVDGNDVVAVREAAGRLVEHARKTGQPAMLEAVSHRMKGHSVVDPAKYRSPEDAEAAREADPVAAFRSQLISAGVLDEDGAAEIERTVQADVDAAVAFADDSPHPDPATLFDYTYATPVANDSRRLPADPVF